MKIMTGGADLKGFDPNSYSNKIKIKPVDLDPKLKQNINEKSQSEFQYKNSNQGS